MFPFPTPCKSDADCALRPDFGVGESNAILGTDYAGEAITHNGILDANYDLVSKTFVVH